MSNDNKTQSAAPTATQAVGDTKPQVSGGAEKLLKGKSKKALKPSKKKFSPKKVNTQDKTSLWTTVAAISALFLVLALLWLAYAVPRNNTVIEGVGELRVISQQLSSNAEAAISSANPEVLSTQFDKLRKDQKKFNDILSELNGIRGNDAVLKKVTSDWAEANKKVSFVLGQEENLNRINELSEEISDAIPEIQVYYNDAINQMLAKGISSKQAILAKNQVILAERILRSINSSRSVAEEDFTGADDFNADTAQFGSVLQAQLTGNAALGITRVNDPEVREKLGIIGEVFSDTFNPAVNEIFEKVQETSATRESVSFVKVTSDKVLKTLTGLDTNITNRADIIIPSTILLLSLLTALYALYKLLQERAREDRKRSELEAARQRKEAEAEMQRAEKIQQENDRNQTAILRLLDELGDLADGDLTINATVSEDFTGAIADSVNFAIDQLRSLVSAINNTAIQVAGSSEETQGTAMQLAESSEHQAQEIAGASAAINEMAVSIDQVSANAVESASVADRSVAIAYNGAEVVQRTIDGMTTIREQIQETAKRIKRLGESSQEIGDIISLINDIADQTNILALNAAIQASTAGEAGRGFAVVADEVQRLAERSANATKQIEGLVKTIQADTNEAVISMELTTAEVVKGAKLAKDAGEALEEVQTVSNTLADLIQNISNAARQQAASAGHISNTMNIIQEITTQTTAGTIATARSVGQLNEMAIALRQSVSGFTLPEQDDHAISAA